MRVLVLGSGAREHALCWKLRQSPNLSALFCAPGNPGTAQFATNIELRADSPVDVVAAATAQKIELVVIGPEAPLVAGVADALRAVGIAVFGPSQAAAKVEGSKIFAKDVMAKAGVPTAPYKVFQDSVEAEAYARTVKSVVIKADGLAAGKGVVVASTAEEAAAGVRACAALGEPGKSLLLEEKLQGEEVSVIALCDGEKYLLLPPARDHKRIGDNDQGPNTGGMGAYCPATSLDDGALNEVGERVIAPTLKELARRGTPFRGALYAGIMLTPTGIQVLEFNCRFGDPETQVLMMQLEEDLLPVLSACAQGVLNQTSLRLRPGASVGVVLAAHGYPASPRSGDPIKGAMEVPQEVTVFHAGTQSKAGQLVTAGGRVLTVCAHGKDLAEARARAYRGISAIGFDGMQFRRDIGGWT